MKLSNINRDFCRISRDFFLQNLGKIYDCQLATRHKCVKCRYTVKTVNLPNKSHETYRKKFLLQVPNHKKFKLNNQLETRDKKHYWLFFIQLFKSQTKFL